jgi:hypothetical protein
MAHLNVRSSVPLRSLLLFAVSMALPALGRADDFGWGGDSSCEDPAIFSDIFTLPATNATGGMCRAFGNYTGAPITSVNFTTTIPDANSDPMICSAGPYFEFCDFVLNPVDGTLTVQFFGTNSDHPGIPVAPAGSTLVDNFFINLNNPTMCDTNGANCTQPDSNTAVGDWLAGSLPEVFTAAVNGAVAPEPADWMLLLAGMSALIARSRFHGNRRVR